jgi:ABC-type sugar transport system ATPase subunit
VVDDVAPRDRDIAMVFQSYALYAHVSVEENLGFTLEMRGVSRSSRESRAGCCPHDAGVPTARV